MKLPVVITTGEDGYLVAEIPVVPGCISQGRTKEEALANIKEAAELCLESMEKEGWTLPKEYTLDQVEGWGGTQSSFLWRDGKSNLVFSLSNLDLLYQS